MKNRTRQKYKKLVIMQKKLQKSTKQMKRKEKDRKAIAKGVFI